MSDTSILGTFDQYSTARPLLKGYPTWIGDPQEQARIAAYQLYEMIYWTIPEAFKMVSRGKEDKPIYIPAAKTIVEVVHRFLAPKMTVITDPTFGEASQQELATQVMTDFVRREKLYSKFNMNKRYGIMRGDWVFYLQADPEREPGSRVSFFALDPASLFWIYNEENIDEIIGAHVVNQFDIEGKPHIKRETWRKTTGTAGPSEITYESAIFKVDEWGGPGVEEKAPQLVLAPPTPLPSPIDHLPFYHVKNFEIPGSIWGTSELAGFERILGALNQSISDEELGLALEALGVYVTTAGTPQDESGNDTGWNLGPGRVVELPETETGDAASLFQRVQGITSVSPYQDHLRYLHEQIDVASGTGGIAKGKVDVSIAESGIALLLEMGPLFAKCDEKETVVTDVTTNMLYDLSKWIIAYEGTAFSSLLEATRWIPHYGDRLPANTQAEFENLMSLAGLDSPVVSKQYIRDRLRKIGYDDMPDEAEMQAQMEAEQQASMDAFAARMGTEIASVTAGAADGGSGGQASGSNGQGSGSNGTAPVGANQE